MYDLQIIVKYVAFVFKTLLIFLCHEKQVTNGITAALLAKKRLYP